MRLNRSLVDMQRRRLDDAAWPTLELARRGLRRRRADRSTRLRCAPQPRLHRSARAATSSARCRTMQSARRDRSTDVSAIAAAISDVDRAEVLRDAGLVTEAERILERAARAVRSHAMPQRAREAEFNLARSLLTHDPGARTQVAARCGAALPQRRQRRLGGAGRGASGSARGSRRAGHRAAATGPPQPRRAPAARRGRGASSTALARPRIPQRGGGAPAHRTSSGRARERTRPPRCRGPRARDGADRTCAARARGAGSARRRPRTRRPRCVGTPRAGWTTRRLAAGRSAASTCRPRPPCTAAASSVAGLRCGRALGPARRGLRLVGARAPPQPAGRPAAAAARSRAGG